MKKWVIALVAVGAVLPFCFGADITDYSHLTGHPEDHRDYWDLSYPGRKKVCRAAAAANPSLVKQLNEAAVTCVSRLQTELAPVVKSHASLSDLENIKLWSPEPSEPYVLLCKLKYFRNTHMVEIPSGGMSEPNKDGIILIIQIHNLLAGSGIIVHGYYLPNFAETFLVQGIELQVSYHLELGKANKDIERPMRDIIEKQLKQFCAEAVKMK